jgi:predicted nucleotidyltransferase component of viral defense system
MTKRVVKDIAASVRQRLLNKAREEKRPFNELLQYYAMERFLYRLSKSPYSKKFVLKGALMLAAWKAPISRPTMDIDLLGKTDNDVGAVVAAIQKICAQAVEPDGLKFDADSVAGRRITEAADYEGVRVRFRGSMGNAQVTMQVDVGFGDIIVPSSKQTEYPTILDMPVPRLQGYSKESMVAEKLESMVKLGVINSRLKDFFDVWLLSQQFDFNGQTLAKAIEKTFFKRGTDIPSEPTALTPIYSEDPPRAAQWRGFVRRNRLERVPAELGEVIRTLHSFLVPITRVLKEGPEFRKVWHAPGPWVEH